MLSAFTVILLVVCGVLPTPGGLGLNHYRDNAITYKAQRDKKVSELKLANATISGADMQQRQHDVAALDAKYSRELADARAENETLRADVTAGRKRLRILHHRSLLVTPPVQAPCVKPPPPPAWAMMPASNSLQLLDETFSVSETESSMYAPCWRICFIM